MSVYLFNKPINNYIFCLLFLFLPFKFSPPLSMGILRKKNCTKKAEQPEFDKDPQKQKPILEIKMQEKGGTNIDRHVVCILYFVKRKFV